MCPLHSFVGRPTSSLRYVGYTFCLFSSGWVSRASLKPGDTGRRDGSLQYAVGYGYVWYCFCMTVPFPYLLCYLSLFPPSSALSVSVQNRAAAQILTKTGFPFLRFQDESSTVFAQVQSRSDSLSLHLHLQSSLCSMLRPVIHCAYSSKFSQPCDP